MGLSFNYVVNQHETCVELYIDRVRAGVDESKTIFDQFEAHKQEIEEGFGEPLEWERLEGKRACRIAKRLNMGGYRNEEQYLQIFDATVDAMIRLERALRPFIQKITV
ncbi:MAG: hypothetical protein AVDCRST_MAG93-2948 [uncultured Chloroflexia bacterium]|uniref:DUF4268 domain-containing protein n=1 Tax=uncultured Chloroflexia bacterium TaxID=1672391 RepID=A0A6J4JEY9_9CHLR|nr:MAG: hypothetical protein AVDCRST_MAG93-2948 [uncultured Chloroflexia bacterium]